MSEGDVLFGSVYNFYWLYQKGGGFHALTVFDFRTHNMIYTYRADVTVTDLPEFVDLMSDNVSINKDVIAGSLTAQVLKW